VEGRLIFRPRSWYPGINLRLSLPLSRLFTRASLNFASNAGEFGLTIIRYAILVTLAIASLCAMISASADSGQRFLVDAGQGGAAASQDFFLWMLAGIAIVTSLSLCRFVVFGIPTLLGGWYASNKQWLGTLLLGALIWGVFYLMKG
jgi:hypothetical protein